MRKEMRSSPRQSLRQPTPQPAPEGAPKVVVVVGPTASGKTRLGIGLAKALHGEIVSADSQQIYRGFDIGSAKPTLQELQEVPHHLVNIAEHHHSLSAGDYARLADQAIAQIIDRGGLPIIVGGTGLWIRALLLGMADLPGADPRLRDALEFRARQEGRNVLHQELAEIDPESAAQIDANNITRVIRALELFALTGEKPSLLRSRHSFARLRYQAIVLGISPPRDVLYRRIDCRTQEMFNMGIEKEVCERMAQGRLTSMSCRALGFSEALAVTRGEWTREKAVEETAKRTRHYAKRQLTWFRADPMVEWLDWPPSIEKVVAKLVMLGFGKSKHDGI